MAGKLSAARVARLVKELEAPENLRLPYSPPAQNGARRFREFSFGRKKLVAFDLNRTLCADALLQEKYLTIFITNAYRALGSPHERGKFLESMERLGTPGCVYKRGNILLENGAVADSEGKLIAPAGGANGLSLPASIKTHTMVDLQVQLRGLLFRRGLPMEEVVGLSSAALLETGTCPVLKGFNDGLFGFLQRHSREKAFIVISDNARKMVDALLGMMGISKVFSGIIPSAEKKDNLRRIFLEEMARHMVDPEEAVMVGDSYSSDVAPLLGLADTVHIAPHWISYPQGREPSLSAPSLNSALACFESTC
jgi:hypothetical protein